MRKKSFLVTAQLGFSYASNSFASYGFRPTFVHHLIFKAGKA